MIALDVRASYTNPTPIRPHEPARRSRPGPSGQHDEAAIANLYNNGTRTLAEFKQLDLIVAIQPRFREVAPVAEVERRFNFERVDVTKLPSGSDDLARFRASSSAESKQQGSTLRLTS